MAISALRRWFANGRHRPISYAEAKQLARDEDPAVRQRLARRPDIRPEVLYFLASDSVAEVRREIASNEATPRQADLILATDQDQDVRGGLAAKIARLVPELSPDEQDNITRVTHEVLEVLARDQASRVRQILAEALKETPDAPSEVIRRLARDVELAVCGPVLENSPVLTDEDLLQIIREGPVQGALAAIGRRRRVAETVSDAIVATSDVEAITDLLANPSAQIREETLDRLVDQAPDIEAWHGPLVRRPRLSPRAIRRLARFVADSLLGILEQRPDLSPETAQTLADIVAKRIEEDGAGGAERSGAGAPGERAENGPTPEQRAEQLHGAGRLGEPEVVAALANGDRRFAMAAIACRAEVPPVLVQQVVSMKDAKGLVSLAWKANLSMQTAMQLQTQLAVIPPREVLRPRGGDGYPLSMSDMEWQLEFLMEMAPGV